MPKTVKVLYAIPTEGHTGPEALHSLLLMAMNMAKLETDSKKENRETQFEFYAASAGRIFVPMAREVLAGQAVDNGCDYIFFCDDDMVCFPDTFYRLWQHNKDVVAALAFTRNPPHDPVLYTVTQGYEKGKEYFINKPVRNYPKDQLVQVDAVGFGCVLIKTAVFKKMAKPWFMSTSPTGEDIFWCYQAGKVGAKIFMDTAVKCAHVGAPILITEETFEQHQPKEDREREQPQYYKYDIQTSLPPPPKEEDTAENAVVRGVCTPETLPSL